MKTTWNHFSSKICLGKTISKATLPQKKLQYFHFTKWWKMFYVIPRTIFQHFHLFLIFLLLFYSLFLDRFICWKISLPFFRSKICIFTKKNWNPFFCYNQLQFCIQTNGFIKLCFHPSLRVGFSRSVGLQKTRNAILKNANHCQKTKKYAKRGCWKKSIYQKHAQKLLRHI